MAAKKKPIYDDNSIVSLKGADRVRQKPAVIFGSDGLEGCAHSMFEILSNSIDEAREGYGNVIEVTRYKDLSISVRDYGRGVPVDYNEKEKNWNWFLVFCELYAGAKYKNNSDSNYEYSLGLNGLGACATQYSSEYMDVTVFRDGYKFSLHFEEGENIGGLTKEKYNYKRTGTLIKWRPDLKVFTEIDIPLQFFKDTLKKQAIVNAGLTFVLRDEETNTKETFCYEKGIIDYVNEVADGKAFSDVTHFATEGKGRDRSDLPDYKLKFECAFCFCNNSNLIEYYHNSSFLEHGGSPDRALRNAFVNQIEKIMRDRNKFNKNESKLTFQDIQDCLIYVSNSFSTLTSYENQTKKSITNKFIQEFITDYLKKQLEIYFIENFAEGEKILEQILVNKRSRETAEKTRINVKKKFQASVDIVNRVKKFVDCRTKDIERRELYIVEGDSALGSCKLGRDAEFQAIIPVRGKILNCLKADIDTIFKSEIIVDLLKVLGCGVEIKSKNAKGNHVNNFDINNLRWNKVIICTDADVDGYQIRTLILAMLYKLVPSLITEGKVFIAESPLYEITQKDDTYFAYNEQEKVEIVSKLSGKYKIQRSKGLGENQPDMMWETTMNPETRRLIKINPEDAELTAETFDLLLGDNLAGRKKYIEDNGYLYLDDLDIS